jgi:hypothetical protein
MEKTELINRITEILKDFGCFSIGELEYETPGIAVGSLGNFVGLAEYFTEDYVEVNVYEPSSFSSDPIDTYEEKWENLSEEVLSEIHFVCEQYEAEALRLEKRISN